MRTTTETVVKLFGWRNRKRWGFFLMKWTAGLKIGACLFERHIPAYDINDIDAGQQGLDKRLRNHKVFSNPKRPAPERGTGYPILRSPAPGQAPSKALIRPET